MSAATAPPPAYPTTDPSASSQLYAVVVPPGVAAGQTFQVSVNGVLMSVVCPEGVEPGMQVQIAVDSQSQRPSQYTTLQETQVYEPAAPVHGSYMHAETMRTERVISPIGWAVCIVGAACAPWRLSLASVPGLTQDPSPPRPPQVASSAGRWPCWGCASRRRGTYPLIGGPERPERGAAEASGRPESAATPGTFLGDPAKPGGDLSSWPGGLWS